MSHITQPTVNQQHVIFKGLLSLLKDKQFITTDTLNEHLNAFGMKVGPIDECFSSADVHCIVEIMMDLQKDSEFQKLGLHAQVEKATEQYIREITKIETEKTGNEANSTSK